MFDHIPVGVGSKGIIPMNARDLEEALEMGMDWSLREGIFTVSRYSRQHNQLIFIINNKFIFQLFTGYIWAEDKEHCEEYGRMLNADSSKVSMRAKKRGLPQVLKIYNFICIYIIYIYIKNFKFSSKFFL